MPARIEASEHHPACPRRGRSPLTPSRGARGVWQTEAQEAFDLVERENDDVVVPIRQVVVERRMLAEARHRLFPARHRFGASLQVRPLSQCPARLIPIARAISTSATHSSRTFRHPYRAWDETEQISPSEQSADGVCQEFHALRSTRSEQRRRLGKSGAIVFLSRTCRRTGADQVLQRGHLQLDLGCTAAGGTERSATTTTPVRSVARAQTARANRTSTTKAPPIRFQQYVAGTGGLACPFPGSCRPE